MNTLLIRSQTRMNHGMSLVESCACLANSSPLAIMFRDETLSFACAFFVSVHMLCKYVRDMEVDG